MNISLARGCKSKPLKMKKPFDLSADGHRNNRNDNIANELFLDSARYWEGDVRRSQESQVNSAAIRDRTTQDLFQLDAITASPRLNQLATLFAEVYCVCDDLPVVIRFLID